MAVLPGGTVTLLFTDIQGSTRLWEDHPEAMEPALERHDEIVRQAIESHRGYVFKTVGDAFCATFQSAGDAVEAVGRAQLDLRAEPWPADTPLRVRMALHTGQCTERDGDYFGPAVNRTARLEATAHGGQVVLSEATAVLVRDHLPDGWALVDLGSHRLKDLGRDEQVFQLVVPVLSDDFPPLRSLDNPALPNNLPVQSASFVGRRREVAEVRELVEASRLLTLVGAGGAGKTRLALQVAAEVLDGSGDGVWLVELAPVLDPEAITSAICQALGISQHSGPSDVSTLLDALESQDILILLDNCEHLIGACAALADAILRRCPTVHLLATSREPLGIGGEAIYRVPSLSLPGDSEDVEAGASDAAELFLARVADQGVSLPRDETTAPLVTSICRRLDGMPLAIELAAARLRSMSLIDVHDRLDQRFRLLTGGSRSALPRQQTLRATVEWSYSLLTEMEQDLLLRLSWFAEGFDLAAAEGVCGFGDIDPFDVADLLGSLVDKSLVANEFGRYRLLETIRQFSVERLVEHGEDEAMHLASVHCAYYLALLEEAAPHLTGAGQVEWIARLKPEYANLRRAMEQATRDEADPTIAVRFAAAFFYHHGFHESDKVHEFFWLLLPSVEQAWDGPGPTTLVRAKVSLAGMGCFIAPVARMMTLAVDAAAIARDHGDTAGLALALAAQCVILFTAGDHQGGRTKGDEAVALARTVGDEFLISYCLGCSLTCSDFRDPVGDTAIAQEAIDISERRGDRIGSVTWHTVMGSLALGGGDYPTARAHFERALSDGEGILDVGDSVAVVNLAMIAVLEGDTGTATALAGPAVRRSRRTGSHFNLMYAQLVVALCAARRGHDRRAAVLLGTTEALNARVDRPWEPFEGDLRTRCIDELTDRLGRGEFDALWDEGRRLTLDDAVALALDTCESTV